jgi:hypothetical protein
MKTHLAFAPLPFAALVALSSPAQAQVSKTCEDAFEGYQAVEDKAPLASSRRVELLRACVAACGRVPPIAKKCGVDLAATGKTVVVHLAAREAAGKVPLRAFSAGFGGDAVVRVSSTEASAPLYLRPGSCPVHLASEGMVPHDDTLVVPEDVDEITLTFDFGAAAKTPPPPDRSPPPPVAPRPVEDAPPPTLQWGTGQYVGFGLVLAGAASLGVGVVFGGLAMDRKSTAGCPGNVCGLTGDRDALAGASRFATASTVAFVAGGILAVGGLLTFVVAPKKRAAAAPVEGRVVPLVTRDFGGASITWTY